MATSHLFFNPFTFRHLGPLLLPFPAVKWRAGEACGEGRGPGFTKVFSAESQSGPETAARRLDGQAARRVEASHEGLDDPAHFLDGFVLPDNELMHALFKLDGIGTPLCGVEFYSLNLHGVPLLLIVLFRVAAHVPYERFLFINVDIYTDVAT